MSIPPVHGCALIWYELTKSKFRINDFNNKNRTKLCYVHVFNGQWETAYCCACLLFFSESGWDSVLLNDWSVHLSTIPAWWSLIKTMGRFRCCLGFLFSQNIFHSRFEAPLVTEFPEIVLICCRLIVFLFLPLTRSLLPFSLLFIPAGKLRLVLLGGRARKAVLSLTENEVLVFLLRLLHCSMLKPLPSFFLFWIRLWSKTLSAMEEAQQERRWEGRPALLTSLRLRWATAPCPCRPPQTPRSRKQGVSLWSLFVTNWRVLVHLLIIHLY